MTTDFSSGPPRTNWLAYMTPTTISAQSTQNVLCNVSGPSSPTSASVSFAFLGPYASTPQAGDAVVAANTTFFAGTWATPQTYPALYPAQCLVGPGGAAALTSGSYAVWVKIAGFGGGETPIMYAGPLVIS
jgi:hypothetical protein